LKTIVFLLCLIFSFQFGQAQWSGDPAINKTIYPGHTYQNEDGLGSSMIGLTDGYTYFTWKDKACLIHIQLYDPKGFPVWPDNGCVLDNPYGGTYSSIADSDNNLIIIPCIHTYNSEHDLERQLLFLKVDRTGHLFRGENDIKIHIDGEIHYSLSPDNELIISNSYITDRGLGQTVRKVDPDGDLVWGEKGIVIDSLDYTKIIGSYDGGFFLLYGTYIGTQHDDGQYDVFLRKYDESGKPSWPRDIKIYSGWFRTWTIRVLMDDDGGFYLMWEPSTVQHFNSDGFEIWSPGGVKVMEDSTARWFVSPQPAGMINNDQLLVLFTRYDKAYPYTPALYGQVIDRDGNLAWGKSGRKLNCDDLSGRYASLNGQYLARICNDSLHIFYIYPIPEFSILPVTIRMTSSSLTDGETFTPPLLISSREGYKSFPQVTQFVNGQAIVSWVEKKDSTYNIIKAQNVYSNGTMGTGSSSLLDTESAIESCYLGYNPVTRIILMHKLEGSELISLYNLMGTEVYSHKASESQILPALPTGMFILVISRPGHQERHKILIAN